jgi:hypothetical protein
MTSRCRGIGLAILAAGVVAGCAPESLESGQCTDRLDNDFDGAADFDDTDCQNWGDCMDGEDNDRDGQVDQADGGCANDTIIGP